MRLAERWRDATQTIKRERDERSELARLRVLRDQFLVTLVTGGAGVMLLLYWPMPDESRLLGFRLLPLVVIAVPAPASVTSRRRHRPYTPEHRQAAWWKMLLWAPLIALVVGASMGASSYYGASGGDLTAALVGGATAAIVSLVAYLALAAIGYRRATREVAGDAGRDERG